MIAVGQIWHNDCFTCGGKNDDGCKRVLKRDGYLDHDSQPYCNSCFSKLFRTKGFGYGNTLNTDYGIPTSSNNPSEKVSTPQPPPINNIKSNLANASISSPAPPPIPKAAAPVKSNSNNIPTPPPPVPKVIPPTLAKSNSIPYPAHEVKQVDPSDVAQYDLKDVDLHQALAYCFADYSEDQIEHIPHMLKIYENDEVVLLLEEIRNQFKIPLKDMEAYLLQAKKSSKLFTNSSNVKLSTVSQTSVPKVTEVPSPPKQADIIRPPPVVAIPKPVVASVPPPPSIPSPKVTETPPKQPVVPSVVKVKPSVAPVAPPSIPVVKQSSSVPLDNHKESNIISSVANKYVPAVEYSSAPTCAKCMKVSCNALNNNNINIFNTRQFTNRKS